MFVATIGFFDGVHRGHVCLIEQVLAIARARRKRSMIVTMDRHPREIVAPEALPKLLTSQEERIQLLKMTGVDDVHVLRFDEAMSRLSACDFMQMLHERLHVDTLVMGYDHHFGHDGGTVEDYQQWGRQSGVDVVLARRMEGEKASSTLCRRLLAEGDVEGAQHLLGHQYLITGRVGTGHQIGRQMGFPTANIEVDVRKLLPKDGVYACKVREISLLESQNPENGGNDIAWNGMLNIGTRPTLDNGSDRTVEVHLIDYSGNLYGKTLQLQLVRRIRDEKKFDSLDELKVQIKDDIRHII